MILHLASDEKFIDMGFRVFEEVSPGFNELVVVASNHIQFVKTKPLKQIQLKDLDSDVFFNYLMQFDAIILHSLFSLKIKLPKNIPVAWIGFGFDYYDLICSRNELLLPNTLEVASRIIGNVRRVKNFIKDTYILNYVYSIVTKQKSKNKFINQISYFAPVLNSEYATICNKNLWFTPELTDWNYGTLEDDLIKGFEGKVVNGRNILVGNSARYTNNHLDIFSLLASLKCENFIFPLSYGYSEYKNEVIKLGNARFGMRFKPLLKFLTMQEYTNILLSCSFVVMNHLRQEALGTIVIMLYLGAKVFLREVNPIYIFLKAEGAKIYSIEELEANPTLIDTLLPVAFIEINRKVLKKHWARSVIHKKTHDFITKIVKV